MNCRHRSGILLFNSNTLSTVNIEESFYEETKSIYNLSSLLTLRNHLYDFLQVKLSFFTVYFVVILVKSVYLIVKKIYY